MKTLTKKQTYPIKNLDGKLDNRYRMNMEFCGYATQAFTARFCDDWLGCSQSYEKALAILETHDKERKALLV